jgi:hypothetical protein
MKTGTIAITLCILMVLPLVSCKQQEKSSDMNIVFLHHSTGGVIWEGGANSAISKAAGKVSGRLAASLKPEAALPKLFKAYNKENNLNYSIEEMIFPKSSPYGWNNYPYDYYNIWVKNEGEERFMDEPTLEILTKGYQVIIFKHCFPVSNILADMDSSDINSDVKTIGNYKLQYLALRDKLHKFPNTKFILFTGAALVESSVTEDEASRAIEFFKWVTEEWDIPEDNIHIWDLRNLQTEGGLYLKNEYAVSPDDSHPNGIFAAKAVKLLFNRIIDVVEKDGKGTLLTGEDK